MALPLDRRHVRGLAVKAYIADLQHVADRDVGAERGSDVDAGVRAGLADRVDRSQEVAVCLRADVDVGASRVLADKLKEAAVKDGERYVARLDLRRQGEVLVPARQVYRIDEAVQALQERAERCDARAALANPAILVRQHLVRIRRRVVDIARVEIDPVVIERRGVVDRADPIGLLQNDFISVVDVRRCRYRQERIGANRVRREGDAPRQHAARLPVDRNVRRDCAHACRVHEGALRPRESCRIRQRDQRRRYR
jgi:hypothetical protein